PYMLMVSNVRKDRQKSMSREEENLFGLDKLHIKRSDIPAITHVDYSARIQTVHKETNSLFHETISRFEEKQGCAVVINTSFNVRGEPIVCTPEDAFRCFMRTNMDYLMIGSFLLDKTEQKPVEKDEKWKKEFQLD
ncbi:MAG: hypothetical protein IIA45_11320, partial [Bacteroidetes bacterium]|nr:hypothetical protein [Bacteroidota bacterium]